MKTRVEFSENDFFNRLVGSSAGRPQVANLRYSRLPACGPGLVGAPTAECGPQSLRFLMSLVLLLTLIASASAQVVMDGTLGRAGALSGPVFQVTPDLGRQVGGNLFHSFSQLNLTRSESATFSGPPSVQNLLARVTGGASSIDGTLRSTIPGANLYLINPGGVMFGPNASVDVSGSFVVSTADYVRLADGGRFDARLPANSQLTAAPLAKFGFLSMAPAKITVDGSQLIVPRGQTITLVGGDIELKNGAQVKALEGAVNMTSVGAAAVEVTATPELTELVTGGTIRLNRGASVDVSGSGGGQVNIRSRDLTVDDAGVKADTTGGLDGRGIDLQLGGTAVIQNGARINAETRGNGKAGIISVAVGSLDMLTGGQFNTSTFGSGNAGTVDLRANRLNIDGSGGPQLTGIFSQSVGTATGNAGSVGLVVSGLLQVRAGGHISSDTEGTGAASGVSVRAGALTIAGGTSREFTGISSRSLAAGRAGELTVLVAEALQLLDGGMISSDMSGTGAGGRVVVASGSLTIDGGVSPGFTGISSRGISSGGAGEVQVSVADGLQLRNRGKISSDTSGAGNAGPVTVTANSLTIDGGFTGAFTGISSDSNNGATGNAGNVSVRVPGRLELRRGGQISSGAFAAGKAGKVAVQAGSLTIDGGTSLGFTGISSDSFAEATGNAGDVDVNVSALLQLLSGGRITSGTFATGKAGRVAVQAGAVTLDGGTSQAFTGIASDSFLGATGDAGNVNVMVQGLLLILKSGQISSATSGAGGAGRVEVRAGAVTIDNGIAEPPRGVSRDVEGRRNPARRSFTGISSSSFEETSAPAGEAGTVRVTVTGALELRHDGQITSAAAGHGLGGSVEVLTGTLSLLSGAAITAAARLNDAGSVLITSSGDIRLEDSRLLATAGGSTKGGGGIGLNSPGWIILIRSGIDSHATGRGGNITIDPQFTILNQSQIMASSGLGDLFQGSIKINEGLVIQSAESQITATGEIKLSNPRVDLGGSLTPLAGGLLGAEARLPERCAVRVTGKFSSFISVGRGGLPQEPVDYQPLFLFITDGDKEK